MPIATVTSKGQITIPVEVRRALGLEAGSRIDFVYVREGIVEMVPVTGSVRALRGVVQAPAGRPVTLEQMDEAIAAGAAGRPE